MTTVKVMVSMVVGNRLVMIKISVLERRYLPGKSCPVYRALALCGRFEKWLTLDNEPSGTNARGRAEMRLHAFKSSGQATGSKNLAETVIRYQTNTSQNQYCSENGD